MLFLFIAIQVIPNVNQWLDSEDTIEIADDFEEENDSLEDDFKCMEDPFSVFLFFQTPDKSCIAIAIAPAVLISSEFGTIYLPPPEC